MATWTGTDLTGLASYPKQAWSRFVNVDNQPHCTSDGFDLLEKLLQYDHRERLTAKEAQSHVYFSQFSCLP